MRLGVAGLRPHSNFWAQYPVPSCSRTLQTSTSTTIIKPLLVLIFVFYSPTLDNHKSKDGTARHRLRRTAEAAVPT